MKHRFLHPVAAMFLAVGLGLPATARAAADLPAQPAPAWQSREQSVTNLGDSAGQIDVEACELTFLIVIVEGRIVRLRHDAEHGQPGPVRLRPGLSAGALRCQGDARGYGRQDEAAESSGPPAVEFPVFHHNLRLVERCGSFQFCKMR